MARSAYIEYLAEQIQDPEFAKEFVKAMNDNHELCKLIKKQSKTITAQEDIIKRLKEDAELWFDNACAFMPASSMPKMSIQGKLHTQLMNELGEKHG